MIPSRAFIETPRLILRGLVAEDATAEYLGWLNDPAVLKYRAPKAFPSTVESLRAYIDSIPSRGDLVLAIVVKESNRHIGNLALNSIQWVHRTAELSIMVGARDLWGQKYGREAIEAVTRHAFDNMGLDRLWAESPNPGFNALMKALEWRHEGTKRAAFLVDGQKTDVLCWGLLRSERAR